MEIKLHKLADFIGSNWIFVFTLTLFVAEAGWLSLTSRFPMAFDEAYHFGLIQYFSHHLNPVITQQSSDSYRFGAIIQDPSFLYHYLMSFPYRLVEVFTKSLEIQVIFLRLINVLFAVFSIITLRKLLRALDFSAALANVLILAFALTPIFTALSAQINYDNLLVLSACLCIYETVVCMKELDNKVFNAKRLLTLLCLCLFASMVKFAFLPIFIAILGLIAWRIFAYQKPRGIDLRKEARKSFKKISIPVKVILLCAGLLGVFLFTRFYIVNLVAYHNPVPQCNQVLNIQDCKQYYAWDSNYNLVQEHGRYVVTNSMNIFKYFAYWSLLQTLELFGEIMPLQGLSYVSMVFITIVCVLAASTLVCTIVNFEKMLRNRGLLAVSVITLLYLLTLFARNYHDYLQLGKPVAIDARYLVPILLYLYALLASGLKFTLNSIGPYGLPAKAFLAAVVILSFVYFGGFSQYLTHITPKYGHISPSDSFILTPT
jgi:hypothetical protein